MEEKFNNEILHSIYEAHWQSLYVSAYKILRNESDARLVVKDVFITLFKSEQLMQKGTEIEKYLFITLRERVLLRISSCDSYAHLLESLGSYVSVIDNKDQQVLVNLAV